MVMWFFCFLFSKVQTHEEDHIFIGQIKVLKLSIYILVLMFVNMPSVILIWGYGLCIFKFLSIATLYLVVIITYMKINKNNNSDEAFTVA